MDKFNILPDKPLAPCGIVSDRFLSLGMGTFLEACGYVHALPYGYNSDRDDLMILFKENRGTCTTKHAVIATLAAELNLPVEKNIGIYAMTETLVTGTDRILAQHGLPYLPMLHCFLVHGRYRVDLTEGNANGKNRSIDELLVTERVSATISAKDEYLLYRNALKEHILIREAFKGITVRQILSAREEGLALLKANVTR